MNLINRELYMEIFPFMPHTLLLASESTSRQILLTEAKIPFNVIRQQADEKSCDWSLPLPKLVGTIARFKMEHVHLPAGSTDQDYCFVLTADTLSQDLHGNIHGKPTNKEDAIAKIRLARAGARLCTAFCLDKKIWNNNCWEIAERFEQTVEAEYKFVIPDEWIEIYLTNAALALSASNAITIEGYGQQFLQCVYGSYSTIVGLPMFELRQALCSIGFFGPQFVMSNGE